MWSIPVTTFVIAKYPHHILSKIHESIEIIKLLNNFNRNIGYPLPSVSNTVLKPRSSPTMMVLHFSRQIIARHAVRALFFENSLLNLPTCMELLSKKITRIYKLLYRDRSQNSFSENHSFKVLYYEKVFKIGGSLEVFA